MVWQGLHLKLLCLLHPILGGVGDYQPEASDILGPHSPTEWHPSTSCEYRISYFCCCCCDRIPKKRQLNWGKVFFFLWGFHGLKRGRCPHGGGGMVARAWDNWSHCFSIRTQTVSRARPASLKAALSDPFLPARLHFKDLPKDQQQLGTSGRTQEPLGDI